MSEQPHQRNTTSPQYVEHLQNELKQATEEATLLDDAFLRKKLQLWVVRNLILAGIYYYFWEHAWLRMTLWITIPLAVFALVLILAMPYLVRKKIDRAQQSIDQLKQTNHNDE